MYEEKIKGYVEEQKKHAQNIQIWQQLIAKTSEVINNLQGRIDQLRELEEAETDE